ncbi:cyclase family protein [Actinomadura madurae]|uniref:cyclase family protein n=1 Tax=Actinomadura madurae TaxID=1993 RepID=UPI000943AF53
MGRGDIVLVRTGRLSRVRHGDGWGSCAGGPAPGLSFETAGRLHSTGIAAIATDTWGFEVRPNEFQDSFQPLHQVASPHIGLLAGEMWTGGRLRAGWRLRVLPRRPAAAVHPRGRLPGQSGRREVRGPRCD